VGLASLLGAEPPGTSEPKRMRTEKYMLRGTIKGAVCKFSMTVTEEGLHLYSSGAAILGGPGARGARSGFIIFGADSKSGTYVEVGEDKLGKRQRVTKVT